jgi:hypothetical protein
MEVVIILGIFLWVLVALWPAFIAKRKGYSFILFWVLGWFISWLLTLILVLLLPTKNQPAANTTPPNELPTDPTQTTGPLDG